MAQERNMIITNSAIYNLKKTGKVINKYKLNIIFRIKKKNRNSFYKRNNSI